MTHFSVITDDGTALPPYLTYEQVAQRWGCAKSAVARRVKRGELETVFSGGLTRIPAASLLVYEAAQRRKRGEG